MKVKNITNSLIKSIIEGNRYQTKILIKESLENGIDIKKILDEGIVKGAEEVGKLYEKAEIYLPDLLLSGAAMNAAIEILKPHLDKGFGKSNLGIILIGTPQGDVHSIGKNIIALLLQGHGYDVIDLGTNVSPLQFVEKSKEINPDVIGLSGLMTVTIGKMQETIILLREENIDSKIIVGGGVITEESCKMVGADAFASDCWDGIKKIKKMIQLKKKKRL
ncbi:MAG: cobalamin-binding protein [Candidatus Lokiarchaeota archaeon]|nr:cobalamin-binding protein [Candidatus Lokiarchaeota archaeon]